MHTPYVLSLSPLSTDVLTSSHPPNTLTPTHAQAKEVSQIGMMWNELFSPEQAGPFFPVSRSFFAVWPIFDWGEAFLQIADIILRRHPCNLSY